MSFKSKGYKVIKNALSVELTSFLFEYFFKKRDVARVLYDTGYVSQKEDIIGHWSDIQIPDTYSHYADIAIETLLVKMLPEVESVVGEKIVPEYSFARIYKHGDELHAHKDRSECEISTTMFLGGDGWKIYFEKEAPLLLEKGDMCIYKGCELLHWREPFEGEECMQVFLHYKTIKEGVKLYDGREMLGLPPGFRQ